MLTSFNISLLFIIIVGAEEIALAELSHLIIVFLCVFFLLLQLMRLLKVLFIGRKLLLHQHLLG